MNRALPVSIRGFVEKIFLMTLGLAKDALAQWDEDAAGVKRPVNAKYNSTAAVTHCGNRITWAILQNINEIS